MAFKTVASSSKTILDITDAYSVFLTNDSYSVVCDKNGAAVVGELGASGKAKTTVMVYKGNSSLTGVASNPGLNQFSYSISTQTGCAALRTDNSTFYINTVAADSGSVLVAVNVEGDASFSKIFTFGKSKTGTDGAPGTPGTPGAPGNPGADGYTVILTNESHTFPGDTASALAGTAVSNVIVYKGATQIVSTISSITGLPTGLTAPITGNGTTSNYFTATATTSLVVRSGELTVNISADGKSFVKKFTFAVTRDGTNGNPGSPGTPAKLVDIVPSALYFVTNTVGTDPATYVYAPGSIALTPTFQGCTYSKWQYSINGSTWTDVTTQNGLSINGTSKVLTVTSTSTLFSTSQTFLIFKCLSTTAEADVVTLNRIFESGALAGRLTSAESAITQNADAIILKVTATEVDNKIKDIQVGGRNLILDSDVPVSNTSYPTKVYTLTEKMIAGKPYTLRIWGTLGAGKTSFTPYLNGGSVSLGALTNNGDGTYSATFIGKDSGVTTGDFIHVYPMPSSTVISSTIDRIKLETGTKMTDFTAAPEDERKYVNDSMATVSSAIEQTANAVKTEVSQNYYQKGETDNLISSVSSQVTQTKDSFDFQFLTVNKKIEDTQKGNDAEFDEIRKYIRFDNGDIILGESTNTVTMRIENNRIAMFVGNVQVSYWEVDETGSNPPKFYVTDGEFLNSLRLGSFAFTPRSNGNLSFGKVN